MTPEYFRAWRAAHPEYQERQRRLRRERRRLHGRGDRSAERAARAARLVGPPDVPLEHPLLAAAAELVPLRASPGAALRLPPEVMREDAIGEAVLAMLERRDPRAAVAAFLAGERRWLGVTAEVLHVA